MGILPTSDSRSASAAPSDPGANRVEARRELLRHRHIWQASRPGAHVDPLRLPTGYPRLDELFGGWPGDGLTELLADRHGIGEARILLPALAKLSREQVRWVCWIAPPYIPYAPALAAAGVEVGRVLLIHPKDHRDLLWATEQALKSGLSSAVLCWPSIRLRGRDVQRLRMAARRGGSAGFVFRGLAEAEAPSAADLRLMLRPPRDHLQHRRIPEDVVEARVLKRRGGWGTEFFRLSLQSDPRRFTLEHLHAQLERWREVRQSQPARRNATGLPPTPPPGRARDRLALH